MLITDVRAHHIRIPYDAGVASFRQGASAISALEMVIVEVSTDAGITGWGDAFAYVSPRTTLSAVNEMIAPQAKGLEVPNATGIPKFMEQIQRNLHLFGRYGITMFAISGLDIALWDLAARIERVPGWEEPDGDGGEPGDGTQEAAGAVAIEGARETKRYRANDFSISRQRSWGTPIPVVLCEACGAVPVPEADLPVVLPRDIKPTGEGNPLAERPDFVDVDCPRCGAAAKRAGGRKAAAAAPSGRRPGRPQKSGGLLTLTQISETTGISYPTLVRYVRIHADKLPSEGKGRARRFYPQAVDVFRQLRSESGRGGRKKGSGAAKKPAATTRGRISAASDELSGMVSQRLKQLEKTQQSLEKKFKGFVDSLQKLFR